ncbi:AAA family ATPase [Burkholderia anthina]|uniref:MinD/ParA family ATP-binding protein n=1 Tax=Burkholderia anthina TaxID=179879 RepID=UPI001CF43401|nr:AAA family ATPase [Burkholderia anthina]MCA8094534.1 AAA family ATPase [Burkholderia anthina]
MDKRIIDQAEGLRRLLAGRASRVVAVTGGPAGVGCTTTVVNLAAALAALGKDVLVVDERAGARSATATLAGTRLRDGERTRVAAGFGLCAAGQGGYSDAQLSDFIDGQADIVLVDARPGADGALSALAREAHDVLIVTRVSAKAITEAYACMKRLHFAQALAQFRVLTNHVGNHADAKTAFDNLAGVASRYLTVSIADAGCVSADPLVERARELTHTAVDAFPSSAAARDYRQIAADLLYWPMRPRSGAGRAVHAGGKPSYEASAAHAA